MLNINRKKFFDTVRAKLGKLSQRQVSAIETLLAHIELDPYIVNLNHVAYILATVKHETANTYEPIAEYGKGRKRRYGKPDAITGHTYYGRGYVQLTWKENYDKMGALVGADLVNNPDLVMEHKYAYPVMSIGMRKGIFTGKKLSDYELSPVGYNFKGARKIINGTDKASLIAGYAEVFKEALS